MSTKVKSVRLSSNPETQVVADAQGVNGKLNVAEDGAKFFMVEVEDNSNPFAVRSKPIMVRQQKNSAGEWVWKSLLPAQFEALKGKTIPGSFKTVQVAPYEINGREVTTYTTFVQDGQNVATLVKAEGHEMVNAEKALENAGSFDGE